MSNACDIPDAVEACAQNALASRREPIRAASVLGRKGFNPSAFFEASNGAVEGAWTKTLPRQRFDVTRHRVSVSWLVGERNQNQKRGL